MRVSITTHHGHVYASEFTTLTNLSRYLTKCLKANRPFNCWANERMPHPVTGEMVTSRSRVLLNPNLIESMYELDENWGAKQRFVWDNGDELGYYTVGESDVSGLPAGTRLPIRRDPNTLSRYVVTGLNADGGEVRFSLSSVGRFDHEDGE